DKKKISVTKGLGEIWVKNHMEISGDSMCNIRRSIICHLACGQKVKNIPALIYAKICGVQKVFQENVIQDFIIPNTKHHKQQITVTGVVCLLKHQRYEGFGGGRNTDLLMGKQSFPGW
uniref:Uncharacterized protein n=1 Tax=Cyanistes caeruleus TaxID=156563 RepID=A0A8C0VCN6_CYACU